MKSRIVTVTLAVALGLCGTAALSQTEALTQDPLAPFPGFDDPLQTGLPLGELGPVVEESIGIEPDPDLSRVERDGEWLYAIRRTASSSPWTKIAVGLCGSLP